MHSPDKEAPRLVSGWILDRVPDREEIAILLHPVEPKWAIANETGVMLARWMDGSRTIHQVAGELARNVGLPVSDELVADVAEFAGQLRRSGLLEDSPADSTSTEEEPFLPSLTIYLTEECNLRCKHCAIVEGRMPTTKLDDAALRTMIAEHASLHPGALITFLGGEPLLHRDCVELLRFAADQGARLAISTNGLLVTPEVARTFAELPLEVQVSLDGPDAESHDAIRGRDTFVRTWRAIELLVEAGAGPRITISTALTRQVARRVRELVGKLDALGVGTVRFLPLMKNRAAVTNWEDIHPEPEELADAVWWATFEAAGRPGAVARVKGGFPGFAPEPPKNRHWCPLGETFIVDSQGETHVCPALTTKEVRGGNALADGIGAVESGQRAKDARNWMLGRRQRVSECQRCEWRNFCQGGCLAFMGHLSGSMDRNDEFCEFRRNLYRRHALQRADIDWKPDDLVSEASMAEIK